MQHRQDRRDIDEAVKALPRLAAEAPNGEVFRRHGQGQEYHKASHADGDVEPLEDVGQDGVKIEPLVKYQIGRQMQERVVESQEPERAPMAQEVDARELTQRSDRKAGDQ